MKKRLKDFAISSLEKILFITITNYTDRKTAQNRSKESSILPYILYIYFFIFNHCVFHLVIFEVNFFSYVICSFYDYCWLYNLTWLTSCVIFILTYITDEMTSQGLRSTPAHPDSWSSSRSHYWLVCWAGWASCAWHWSCCWGPPVSSATRGTSVAGGRKMVKCPSLHRLSRHSLWWTASWISSFIQ